MQIINVASLNTFECLICDLGILVYITLVLIFAIKVLVLASAFDCCLVPSMSRLSSRLESLLQISGLESNIQYRNIWWPII